MHRRQKPAQERSNTIQKELASKIPPYDPLEECWKLLPPNPIDFPKVEQDVEESTLGKMALSMSRVEDIYTIYGKRSYKRCKKWLRIHNKRMGCLYQYKTMLESYTRTIQRALETDYIPTPKLLLEAPVDPIQLDVCDLFLNLV